jgi:hypothetical protein
MQSNRQSSEQERAASQHVVGRSVQTVVRHIWVVALVLERIDGCSVMLSQTISWNSCESQNEALGQAILYASKTKAGFAVKMHTIAKIELPNPSRQGIAHGQAEGIE